MTFLAFFESVGLLLGISVVTAAAGVLAMFSLSRLEMAPSRVTPQPPQARRPVE